jgi:transcriptional antiterminator NusG
VNGKRLSEAQSVGPTDRHTAAIDRARGMSRRAEALLAAAGQSESAMHWYVLRTDAHAEKDVDNLLHKACVERWLPFMRVADRRRGGRKKVGREAVEILAWPGYIFVRVVPSAEAWAGLRMVKGIVGVLGADEKPFPVKHEKVLQLKVFLEGNVIAIGEIAKQLTIGEMVRMNTGPFAHHNGVVSELCEDGRARVEMMIFGRAVPITVSLDQIDKG